jgi:hypothetical protein
MTDPKTDKAVGTYPPKSSSKRERERERERESSKAHTSESLISPVQTTSGV